MAARRLVIVMLVLLFLSSLAAALAPVERTGDDEASTTQTDAATTAADGRPAQDAVGGELVRAALDADSERRPEVRAHVGDQLQLSVHSERPVTVEIPALGASEGAVPADPARFDLLLSQPGSYAVRLLESRRRIGTLTVRSQARPERAPDRARDRRAAHEP